MQLNDHLPDEAAEELPPSALLVYAALVDGGTLSTNEIAGKTMLCPRTIRNGLAALRDQDLAEKQPVPGEPRRFEYRTTPPKSSTTASTSTSA